MMITHVVFSRACLGAWTRDVRNYFDETCKKTIWKHCNDVIISDMASQITGVSIVCSTVGTGPDQRKHQSSASLAFVRGNYRWPVNSPHKRPVTRKMFSFDDVIMFFALFTLRWHRVLSWHTYSCNTRIHLPCTINATAVDDPATQGARASSATVLT